MRKAIRQTLVLLGSMMLLLVLFSQPTQAAKLNKKNLSLKEGASVALKVTGTKKKVTWASSDDDVAVVSAKGKVTAIREGKAVIKAKIGKKKLKCVVKVKPAAVIKTDKKRVTVQAGETVTLKVTFLKDNPYEMKWKNTSNIGIGIGEWDGDAITITVTGKNAGDGWLNLYNTFNSYEVEIPIKVKE